MSFVIMNRLFVNYMDTRDHIIILRWIILILVIVVIVMGFFLFLSFSKQNEFRIVNNPQKAKEVAKSLKEIVGKLYVLPEEDPKVATVVDTNALPKDPFYKSAQNGDKILIFPMAQKIILYRPSLNKVVDVGEAAPNQNPSKNVAGAKAEVEIKAQTSTDSGTQTVKTQPKILFNGQ